MPMTDVTHPVAVDTPREAAPQPWPPAALAVFALVLVSGLAMIWLARTATLTIGGDDAIHIALSRSLATGHYRDEFLVGAPPHAQYPPGMPALLLLIRTVVGASLDAALGANLFLLGLTVFLAADAVRRLGYPWLAVAVAMAVVYNPALLDLTIQLRSEALYLACCALGLWVSLRIPTHRAAGALALAAALAAFLTRSVGIAMIPAVLAAILIHRGWRQALTGSLIAGAVVIGWFRYTAWATAITIGHTYAKDLAVFSAPDVERGFLVRVLANIKYYLVHAIAVPFSLPDIPGQPLDNAVVAILLLAAGTLGTWALLRRWPALSIFFVGSIGVLLIFPWAFARYFSALYPWIVIVLLFGIARAAGSRRGERVAVAVGVVLGLIGGWHQAQAAVVAQSCRTQPPYADPRCYDPETRSFAAAAKYITDSLPADAVIATSKPSTVWVATGRLTFPLERLRDETDSLAAMAWHPATHILLTRLMDFEGDEVAPLLHRVCDRVTLLGEFPPGTLLLAPRTPRDSTPNACTALAHYLTDITPQYEKAPPD